MGGGLAPVTDSNWVGVARREEMLPTGLHKKGNKKRTHTVGEKKVHTSRVLIYSQSQYEYESISQCVSKRMVGQGDETRPYILAAILTIHVAVPCHGGGRCN